MELTRRQIHRLTHLTRGYDLVEEPVQIETINDGPLIAARLSTGEEFVIGASGDAARAIPGEPYRPVSYDRHQHPLRELSPRNGRRWWRCDRCGSEFSERTPTEFAGCCR